MLFISGISTYISDNVVLEKYADDILTYLIGDHDPKLQQEIAHGIDQWCADNKMRLNIAKCKVISYTPKLSPPMATINLYDIPLEVVPYYKYLGIMLSPSMN